MIIKPAEVRLPRINSVALQLATVLFVFAPLARSATVIGPWVPIFKGIEHAVATNTPANGGFPETNVVHCLRVDLTDPDIHFFTSPRRTNWVSDYTETYGMTCTNFLKTYNLQVAINANRFFQPGSSTSPSYTLAEGSAMNASGYLVSQGVMVSPGTGSASDSSTIYFNSTNFPSIFMTNYPMASTAGVYTAVSGHYGLVSQGVNVVPPTNCISADLDPRTAFGITQDKRYLLLMTIDGRQGSYSVGACASETADWMILFGAYEAVNVDGGGSTAMVIMDSTGKPLPLNRDSASVSVGRERTVGASFGVYAAALPGFFTNLNVVPSDTTATITWSTISAATTQLRYGFTTNTTSLTTSNSALTVNHAVLLTNLTANTTYYYNALASIGTSNYVSPTYTFITTNYATTNALFDLSNSWKYATSNLDGTNWTARNYNDSGWDGSGPGALWVDINGANPDIPIPLSTEMPWDPGTGLPYVTYYFRTHFNYSNSLSGVSLLFQDYLDDGAVFYLNGVEIYRLRMTAAPAAINNSTLASGYACSGNATCPDNIMISGPVITTNLLVGDNVLAAEVHNYSAGSPDITFGLTAWTTAPYVVRPTLNLVRSNDTAILNWNYPGFILQQSSSATGTWADVSGPVFISPFTTNFTGTTRYFRLRK